MEGQGQATCEQNQPDMHATSAQQGDLSFVRNQRCPMCHSVISAPVAPSSVGTSCVLCQTQ